MRIPRVPGLAAAATLAAVTLGVFATFQDYGPESAVRRFHHAVVSHDLAEIAQVVDTGPDSSAVRELAVYVEAALRGGGANYRIVKSERSPKRVEMLALYQDKPPIVWVVTKGGDRWRIDTFLTLQGLQNLQRS